jgi:hypothetical protein
MQAHENKIVPHREFPSSHCSPQFALSGAQYVQKVARLKGEERIGCQNSDVRELKRHRNCGAAGKSNTATLSKARFCLM